MVLTKNIGKRRKKKFLLLFIYLFGVLSRFQHCTGHITMGSWKGRGNQYIQFVRVLYYKLLTNGKQLPAFPLEVVLGIEPGPQRWEERVLSLCHHGPDTKSKIRTNVSWDIGYREGFVTGYKSLKNHKTAMADRLQV